MVLLMHLWPYFPAWAQRKIVAVFFIHGCMGVLMPGMPDLSVEANVDIGARPATALFHDADAYGLFSNAGPFRFIEL